MLLKSVFDATRKPRRDESGTRRNRKKKNDERQTASRPEMKEPSSVSKNAKNGKPNMSENVRNGSVDGRRSATVGVEIDMTVVGTLSRSRRRTSMRKTWRLLRWSCSSAKANNWPNSLARRPAVQTMIATIAGEIAPETHSDDTNLVAATLGRFVRQHQRNRNRSPQSPNRIVKKAKPIHRKAALLLLSPAVKARLRLIVSTVNADLGPPVHPTLIAMYLEEVFIAVQPIENVMQSVARRKSRRSSRELRPVDTIATSLIAMLGAIVVISTDAIRDAREHEAPSVGMSDEIVATTVTDVIETAIETETIARTEIATEIEMTEEPETVSEIDVTIDEIVTEMTENATIGGSETEREIVMTGEMIGETASVETETAIEIGIGMPKEHRRGTVAAPRRETSGVKGILIVTSLVGGNELPDCHYPRTGEHGTCWRSMYASYG